MPQISLNTGIADHEMGLQSQKRNCQDEVADERRISLAYLGEKEIYYKAQKKYCINIVNAAFIVFPSAFGCAAQYQHRAMLMGRRKQHEEVPEVMKIWSGQ